MPTSLVVVDDFLTHAEAFRATALGLSYPEQAGPFPGRNSSDTLALEGLAEEVSALVREPLRPLSTPGSHAKCRISLARDASKPAKVHIDPAYWSGILYLSKPEDCQGGTEFFRHIPTGTDQPPQTPEGLRAIGFSSYEELSQQVIRKDGLDRSKWEPTMTVPMRFNRLVLLRPWLWHTAGPGFGDSLENGRLVYLMFFTRSD